MSEWRECKFKELFSIPLKNGLTKPSKIRGSGLRMVNMKEIFGFNFIDDKTPMERVPVSENEIKNSLLSYDDLLFARQSLTEEGAGKISIFRGKEETVFESHLIRCRIDKNKADSNFIYYLFKSPIGKGNISSIVQQVAAAGIKGSDLQNLQFKIPPLPEQKAIATVLSSLDDKIDLLHRQNKTLEAMAETLFKQWFIIEANEDWEEKTITEFFEVRDGTHDSPKQKPIGKPLITSKHLSANKVDIENAYLISEEDFENINKRSKVEGNDILFSMIGTIGLIYFEQSNIIDYAIKNIGLFKTSQNLDWCYYTYLWLKSDFGQDFIHEHRSGSTQEYISLGSLRSIIFNAPPLEKLNKFNDIVSPLFSKKYANAKQIQTLETLRDTLLPKLMSGEVRVNL